MDDIDHVAMCTQDLASDNDRKPSPRNGGRARNSLCNSSKNGQTYEKKRVGRPRKTYTCSKCSEIFSGHAQLKSHAKSCHQGTCKRTVCEKPSQDDTDEMDDLHSNDGNDEMESHQTVFQDLQGNISSAQSNKDLSQCFSSIAIEPCCSEQMILDQSSSDGQGFGLKKVGRPRKTFVCGKCSELLSGHAELRSHTKSCHQDTQPDHDKLSHSSAQDAVDHHLGDLGDNGPDLKSSQVPSEDLHDANSTNNTVVENGQGSAQKKRGRPKKTIVCGKCSESLSGNAQLRSHTKSCYQDTQPECGKPSHSSTQDDVCQMDDLSNSDDCNDITRSCQVSLTPKLPSHPLHSCVKERVEVNGLTDLLDNADSNECKTECNRQGTGPNKRGRPPKLKIICGKCSEMISGQTELILHRKSCRQERKPVSRKPAPSSTQNAVNQVGHSNNNDSGMRPCEVLLEDLHNKTNSMDNTIENEQESGRKMKGRPRRTFTCGKCFEILSGYAELRSHTKNCQDKQPESKRPLRSLTQDDDQVDDSSNDDDDGDNMESGQAVFENLQGTILCNSISGRQGRGQRRRAHLRRKYICGKCSKVLSGNVELKSHIKSCCQDEQPEHTKPLQGSTQDAAEQVDDPSNTDSNVRPCQVPSEVLQSTTNEVYDTVENEQRSWQKKSGRPIKKFMIICANCSEVLSGHAELRSHAKRCQNKQPESKTSHSSTQDAVDEAGDLSRNDEKDTSPYQVPSENFLSNTNSTCMNNTVENGEGSDCDDLGSPTKSGHHTEVEVKHKRGRGRPKLPLSCNICSATFVKRELVLPHMREAHGEEIGWKPKSFLCPECGKSFKSDYACRLHLKVKHQGSRTRALKCPRCPKSFFSGSSLYSHIRSIHTKLRPFLCTTCGSTFSRRYSLKSHMKYHTGVREHVCSACGKAFVQRDHLARHMTLHTGDKPFKCQFCPAKYSNKPGLNIHLKRSKSCPGNRLRVGSHKPVKMQAAAVGLPVIVVSAHPDGLMDHPSESATH